MNTLQARRRAHIPMEQMPALAKPPAAPTTPQHPAAAIDLLTPFQLRRRSMETPAERAEIEAAASLFRPTLPSPLRPLPVALPRSCIVNLL